MYNLSHQLLEERVPELEQILCVVPSQCLWLDTKGLDMNILDSSRLVGLNHHENSVEKQVQFSTG